MIVTTSRRLVYSSSKESLSILPPASPNVDRVEVHNREGNEVKSNSVSGGVTDVDIQFAFLKSQAIRVFNPEKYANITAMTDNIIEI